MILDKLLEKKDVYAYINFRKKELRATMKVELSATEPKHREAVKQRFMGRIFELEQFEYVVRSNLKRASVITATNVKRKERG